MSALPDQIRPESDTPKPINLEALISRFGEMGLQIPEHLLKGRSDAEIQKIIAKHVEAHVGLKKPFDN
jgi:hypothetical protein